MPLVLSRFLLFHILFVQVTMCVQMETPSQLIVSQSYHIPGSSDVVNSRVMYRTFDPTSEEFVFVSGKNHIYQLNAHDLSLMRQRIIGPRNFSIFCIAENDRCDSCPHLDSFSLPHGYTPGSCEPRLTDNFVKAWATSTAFEPESSIFSLSLSFHTEQTTTAYVNDDRVACEDALYVCYSAHHGSCERLKLTDITQSVPWVPKSRLAYNMSPTGPIPVAGSDPHTLTVMAVGSRYVYVATESDELRKYALIDYLPLSARLRNFQLADSGPGLESFLELTTNQNFRIQYKLAFRYRQPRTETTPPAHIYFILQHPETSTFFRWQPRISRICDDDPYFHSYVELHLACENCANPQYSHLVFNALHKAARGSAGNLLAQNIKSNRRHSSADSQTVSSEVLVVAFAAQLVDPLSYETQLLQRSGRSSHHQFLDTSLPIPLNGSAIVVIAMDQVDQLFDRVVTNCLAGKGVSGPSHFLRRRGENDRCIKDTSSSAQPYYCPSGRTINRMITGDRPEDTLKAPAFLYLPQNVTDIAITSVSDQFTVVLITTYDGFLHKYEVNEGNRSRHLDSIRLTATGKPLTGIALDATGSVAFVTSADEVFRVLLSNCSAYTTCASCVEAHDPYCGWCLIEGRCMLSHECQLSGTKRVDRTDQHSISGKRCDARHQDRPDESPQHRFSWLAYNVPRTKCPVIYQTIPSGVEKARLSPDSMTSTDQRATSILIKLTGNIATDLTTLPHFRDNGFRFSGFRPPDSTQNQLICTFRTVSNLSLLPAGQLLPSALQGFLLPVKPGKLLTTTIGRLVSATLDGVDIQCPSPSTLQLPAIPADQAFYPIIIWLEWLDSLSESRLAPGLFAVYDCTGFMDCRSCTDSRFNCAWCVLDDRCVSATEDSTLCSPSLSNMPPYQGNDSIILMGQASICPSFRVSGQPITLMTGSSLTVKLNVFNLRQPVKHFTCVEGCTGQRAVPAYNAAKSTVICHLDKIDLQETVAHLREHHLNLPSDALNCSLDLFWHGQDDRDTGHKMINEDDTKVEVYACDWLASHCDSCLDLPPRFSCGWCTTTDSAAGSLEASCSTRNQCENAMKDSITVKNVRWLQSNDLCPDPQILSITPLNGTPTGQTILHVVGRNLGWRAQDLSGQVYLNLPEPVPCAIIPSSYIRARSFDCQLSAAPSLNVPASAGLRVTVGLSRYQALSPVFRFLTPQLNQITPERGPVSGGSRLRLSGSNLNIGAKRSILLSRPSDDFVPSFSEDPEPTSIPCDIESESNDLIVCLTRPLPSDLTDLMVLHHSDDQQSASDLQPDVSSTNHIGMTVSLINDMTLTQPSIPFQFFYSPDPRIDQVDRLHVLAGGGTTMRVRGDFLFVIESPRIIFFFNRQVYSSPCFYTSSTLECISPTITSGPAQQSPKNARHKIVDDRNLSAPLVNLIRSTIVTEAGSDLHPPTDLHDMVEDSLSKSPVDLPSDVVYGFMMDGVSRYRFYGSVHVYRDPEVSPFPDGLREEELDNFVLEAYPDPDLISLQKSGPSEGNEPLLMTPMPSARPQQLLRLYGQFDALIAAPELAAPDELQVRVGDFHTCAVSSVIDTEIRCDLDRATLVPEKIYAVTVQFGSSLVFRPGSVRFVRMSQITLRKQIIIISVVLIIFALLVALIALVLWRRFSWRQRDYQSKLDQKYALHESRVIRIFKEDFMELQTSMSEFSQVVKKHNLPYRDYRTFCIFTLFPEFHSQLMTPVDPHSMWDPAVELQPMGSFASPTQAENVSNVLPHPLLSAFTVPVETLDTTSKGISLFHALISSRRFLGLLVRVIDDNGQVTAQDKSRVASLLCAILQPKMDYLTRVMCDLIAESLQKLQQQGDQRLTTAFRRCETIADKFVSNWLCFLLHTFILNNVGEHLFYLYRALLQQIYMGPRDAVTGKARYTLDTSTLLQTELTGAPLSLLVEDPQHLFNLSSPNVVAKVLDCDTISQAKEKILDVLYKNAPYSSQLKSNQLDLIDLGAPPGAVMCDWDMSVRSDLSALNPPVRLNCIKDYQLTDDSRVALVICQRGGGKSAYSSPTFSRSKTLDTFKKKKFDESPQKQLWTSYTSPDPVTLSTAATITARTGPDNSLPSKPIGDFQASSNGLFETTRTLYPNSSLSMRPVGCPDPSLWYHLELPTSRTELALSDDHRSCPYDSSYVRVVPSGFFSEAGSFAKMGSVGVLDRLRHFCYRWRKTTEPDPNEMAPSRLPLLYTSPTTLSTSSAKSKRRKRRSKPSKSAVNGKQDSVTISQAEGSLPKEVFFNRLMVTRLSVAPYMDKLFEVIFSSVFQSKSLPFPIKYLFDFLDTQALSLGVSDPKIVHAWKSNCLQMRFWNQILTNLDYVFDVPLVHQTAFERSLHALSQAMTYACAPTKEQLTPDSSSVKVLFAREIAQHWNKVNSYYREIKALPAIKREEVQEILQQHSAAHSNDFNISWALYELYTNYVTPCYDQLVAQLQQQAFNTNYQCNSKTSVDPKLSVDSTAPEFSESYSPLQLLQLLSEVNQCLSNSRTSIPTLAPPSSHGVISHELSRPYRLPTDSCPPLPNPGASKSSIVAQALHPLHPSGDTTDYLDTLHSLQTLTTESALDDPGRTRMQPQHCYNLYGPNEDRNSNNNNPLSPSHFCDCGQTGTSMTAHVNNLSQVCPSCSLTSTKV